MSSQLKLLKRIQNVRERMRDAAAAELAIAEQERAGHARIRDDTERIRQEIMVEAQHRLGQARGINELEKVGIEMSDAESFLQRAEQTLKKSADSKQIAVSRLRERERAVRLSEELVERKKQDLRKSADKEEQAMIDDIVASRWSNSNE